MCLLLAGIGGAYAADGPFSFDSVPPPTTIAEVKVIAQRLTSEDPVVDDQALHAIVDQGDASVLVLLEAVLSDVDRATRVAVKPVKIF